MLPGGRFGLNTDLGAIFWGFVAPFPMIAGSFIGAILNNVVFDRRETTTHIVMLSQGILFRGADFSAVWPQFLALGVIGVVLFVVALARFRKTIGSM